MGITITWDNQDKTIIEGTVATLQPSRAGGLLA